MKSGKESVQLFLNNGNKVRENETERKREQISDLREKKKGGGGVHRVPCIRPLQSPPL